MKNTSEDYYSDYSAYTDSYDNDTFYRPVTICINENLDLFVSSYIPPVYFILFFLSLFGNTVILVILAKFEKLNSVTNIFILNLVISDLIFTITFPFTAVSHLSDWVFGNVMCKLTVACFFTGFQSFVIFITLMTIDQYLTIVHSWSATSRLMVRYAKCISIFAWSASIMFSIPDIVIYTTTSNNSEDTECSVSSEGHTRWWLILGHYKYFVVFFLLPLLIVIFCYAGIVLKITTCNIRSRDRVLKLIFFIVLFYFICWSPYNILMFLMFLEKTESFKDCNSILHYVFYVCQTIIYFHCSINPLLYAVLGTKFRRHLSCSWVHCNQRRINQQQDFSLRTSLEHGL
uniref:G-protein coupled receptors family 1 profile domain-containing protein n=1 Tax=Leptobrachium leishanense TaxID=445787 RepID=A0A8C5Q0V1_9ANUR